MELSFAQTEGLMEMLCHVQLPPELQSNRHIKRSSTGNLNEKKKKGTSGSSRSQLKKTFKVNCELFIKFSVEHTRAMPPNWCEFFYKRMIQHQNILDSEFILSCLEAYHRYYGWFKSKNSEYAMVALSLIEYFKTHVRDPDNVLIGLKINSEIFSKYYEKTADGKKYRLPHGVTPTREPIILPDYNSSSAIYSIFKGNRKKKPTEKEEDSVDNYISGEIAIWCKNPIWKISNCSYVRVAEKTDDNSVLVYHNPSQTESELISLSQIAPLHPEMEGMIGDVKKMLKLVADPIDEFFNTMTENVKERTNKFLKENGIDTNILQEILDRGEKEQNLLTIKDLPILQKINEKFLLWSECPPNDFYEDIANTCKLELEKLENNPPDGIFQPTKNKAFDDLKSVHFAQLAKNRVNRFIGNCETALGYLKIVKSQFTNGTKKNELTAWWLTKIDKAARKLLSDKNYDDAAIPEDYISERPKDLIPIKNNLEIIEKLLNPSGEDGRHEGKEFADSLKDEIYIKINEFIADISIIISDMLGFDSELFSLKFALETLNIKKDQLETTTFSCISDMIKDVEYLLEMQEMENPKKQISPTGGLVLSNVVPVSGLILSTFYRRENVLRTILELYDFHPKKKQNSATLDKSKGDNTNKGEDNEDNNGDNKHENNQNNNEDNNEDNEDNSGNNNEDSNKDDKTGRVSKQEVSNEDNTALIDDSILSEIVTDENTQTDIINEEQNSQN